MSEKRCKECLWLLGSRMACTRCLAEEMVVAYAAREIRQRCAVPSREEPMSGIRSNGRRCAKCGVQSINVDTAPATSWSGCPACLYRDYEALRKRTNDLPDKLGKVEAERKEAWARVGELELKLRRMGAKDV